MKNKEIHDLDKLFLLATRKLKKSNCSVVIMKEFLKGKGASKKEIQTILEKLERYSYLNEDELIKNVINLCDIKHFGYKKIIQMLKDRRIDPKKINKVKKDETRELEQCNKMLETLKKRYKNVNTLNIKRKVFSALIRFGFDENLASISSSNVSKSHQEEINVLKLDCSKVIPLVKRKVKPCEIKDKITKILIAKGYQINDIRKVLEETIYEMDKRFY